MLIGQLRCLQSFEAYGARFQVKERANGENRFTKEFIKTGITPKDYLDFVCSILHISRKVKIILLDGTVQEAKILDFLDMSYDLTDGRIEESMK